MTPIKQAIKELKQNGYILARHGSNHDVYINKSLGSMITLKRHDFDETDLRYIRKEIRQAFQKSSK